MRTLKGLKSIMAVSLVSIIIVILLSGSSMALNVSDVQVTLKSKNFGPDPNWGGSRANILITMNKMGNLTYIENYYSTDASGQPKLYSGNRNEVAMQDYTVSFDVIRPNKRHEQEWSMIKSTIILDRVTVYEVWINTSGTYRSFTGRQAWANSSTVDIGKGRPVIQKKEPFNPMSTVGQVNNTAGVENNTADDVTTVNKSPSLDISVIIGTIFSVYVLGKYSNRKKRSQ